MHRFPEACLHAEVGAHLRLLTTRLLTLRLFTIRFAVANFRTSSILEQHEGCSVSQAQRLVGHDDNEEYLNRFGPLKDVEHKGLSIGDRLANAMNLGMLDKKVLA